MPDAVIAAGTEPDVHHTIYQHQTGPLKLPSRVELKSSTITARTSSWHGGLNHDGGHSVGSRGNVKSMKAEELARGFRCLSHHIEGARSWVDYRCRGDPDLRNDIACQRVGGRLRCYAS